MSKHKQPRHPGRCQFCFKVVGLSWPGLVIPFHKGTDGKTCTGVGRLGDPLARS
jgi:hypothetical protein